MAQIFIIDEWLWSDLEGENGEEKQKEAFQFLEKLYNKCDKIAVAEGSKFMNKAWKFVKKAQDVVRRKIAKFCVNMILLNLAKCEEIDIKDETDINLAGINPDDLYLIKTYYKTKAPIITTDIKLKSTLEKNNIPCKLRDDFLREYCKSSPNH